MKISINQQITYICNKRSFFLSFHFFAIIKHNEQLKNSNKKNMLKKEKKMDEKRKKIGNSSENS